MSTSKHTPGPWKFQPSVGHHSRMPAVEIGRTVWGVCYIPGTGDVVRAPELEANARLIAAAPDMLAALKALLEADSECWCHGGLICELHKALDAAEASIEKAEGEGEGKEP